MIKVLICDDHWVVRQGLRQTLADAGDVLVMDEADNGVDCLRLAERLRPDVLLLDIALPGRDGLETLADLRRQCPKLAVLMLSTYPERQYAVRCIREGALGYLHKSADAETLLAAIRAAAAGQRYLTPAVAEAMAVSMSLHRDKAGHELLSQREQQVFGLLARGRTVGQIAEQLALSSNTVSTYRARILEKTGASNDVELALYAVRQRLLDP
ncbi:MAG: response regulator transcription factor [Burkholderiales bacterium]